MFTPMKLLTPLLFFLYLSTSAQWVQKYHANFGSYVLYMTGKVVVPDSLSIRAIGIQREYTNGAFGNIKGYSRVQYSNDGGNTVKFSPAVINSSYRFLSDIFCLGKDTTFIITNKTSLGSGIGEPTSIVYRSVDGVDSFLKVSVDNMFLDEGWANFIHFFDHENGCVVGDLNYDTSNRAEGKFFEIYSTSNVGSTWARVPSARIPKSLNKEHLFSGVVSNSYTTLGNTMWFVTSARRVYKSSDRGENWEVYDIVPNLHTEITGATIAFKDALNGLVGFNGYVYKTTDGGLTWSESYNAAKLVVQTKFYPANIQFVKGSNGIYLGTNDKVENIFSNSSGSGLTFYSYDGADWKLLAKTKTDNFTTDISLSALCFTSKYNGWIGGLDASLYKWGNKELPPQFQILSPTEGQILSQNKDYTVSWTSSSNDSVNIYYATDGGFNWVPLLLRANPTGTFHWLTPMVTSEKCAIRVEAVYDTTYYNRSELFSIRNTTGLNEFLREQVMVYPNPTSGIVNIESEWPIKRVTLYDVFGEKLIQSTHSSVDCRKFAKGLYFIRVELEQGEIVLKLFKEDSCND
jgi:photosystem II stability/assembly factor-like uncharacterized protein